MVDRAELSPRMLRLVLEGDGLRAMPTPEPASSVRLLVPSPGAHALELPQWNGNEFLLADGSRPALRTFTPLRFDADAGRLELEIVRHPGGVVSSWAETAQPGDPAAISGPGRGWALPADTTRLILLGDETALPAITQLWDLVDTDVAVSAHVEVVDRAAVQDIGTRVGATIEWHVRAPDAAPGAQLVAVAAGLHDPGPTRHVWAAGEAASMQAIRTHCFDQLGLPRSQTTIRGYWKPAPGQRRPPT